MSLNAPDTSSLANTARPTTNEHFNLLIDNRATVPVKQRLERAKWAYTTRFVEQFVSLSHDSFELITDGDYTPQAGDVVLARVVEIGQHKALESPHSRRQNLFLDDDIVVAYGARYASDQFHAVVPENLAPCNLAAAGGMAATVVEQHGRMKKPTVIIPVGVLKDRHGVVTLQRAAQYSVDPDITTKRDRPGHRVPVIAVLGTSMNSGKSTTLACLARGLSRAGLTVAAGKATGTGAGNDSRLFSDAGAHTVIDFTDFGYSSTFQLNYEDLQGLFLRVVDQLATPSRDGVEPDVVLVEIADGLFQLETARLLACEEFESVVDHIVFAAGDSLGAVGGVGLLHDMGRVPSLVSGVVTASPLAAKESRDALDVPVTGTYRLCEPAVALDVLRGTVDDPSGSVRGI